MLLVMLISLGAITLLFIYLLKIRVELEKIKVRIDRVYQKLQEENL